MIDNLRELNDKVNAFVNYVVKTACEQTSSGQYYVSVDAACFVAGMSSEEFLEYKDLIMNEIGSRDEVLDFDYRGVDKDIDVTCALNYCPNYEWTSGDEDIFGSYEEFKKREVLPVGMGLSLARMAEIGADAISCLAYKEEKVLEDVVKNSLGLSDNIASAVITSVEARKRDVVAKLETTILENDEKLKQQEKVVGTIVYHYTSNFSETVKYTDVKLFLAAYDDALDTYGPNGCTATLFSEDLGIRYEFAKISYGVYGEAIEPFEQWKAKLENCDHEELYKDSNFIDDMDKMKDFETLSKDEFLRSYSYLTEEEYDNTLKLIQSNQFIFDDEIMINDDRESINGYLWAVGGLVERLPLPHENIENVNFYVDYNLRTGDIKVTSSYDTPVDDGETNKVCDVFIADDEKPVLISKFEEYCSQRYSQSCLEFVNECRAEENMPELQRNADKPSLAEQVHVAASLKNNHDALNVSKPKEQER